jgi:hypothetical protein
MKWKLNLFSSKHCYVSWIFLSWVEFRSGSMHFAESGSGSRLLLKPDPIRIRIQTKVFYDKEFFFHPTVIFVLLKVKTLQGHSGEAFSPIENQLFRDDISDFFFLVSRTIMAWIWTWIRIWIRIHWLSWMRLWIWNTITERCQQAQHFR